jgi:hypothetical protein
VRTSPVRTSPTLTSDPRTVSTTQTSPARTSPARNGLTTVPCHMDGSKILARADSSAQKKGVSRTGVACGAVTCCLPRGRTARGEPGPATPGSCLALYLVFMNAPRLPGCRGPGVNQPSSLHVPIAPVHRGSPGGDVAGSHDRHRWGVTHRVRAAAGTTPTGSPAPRCRTPPYARPRLPRTRPARAGSRTAPTTR